MNFRRKDKVVRDPIIRQWFKSQTYITLNTAVIKASSVARSLKLGNVDLG